MINLCKFGGMRASQKMKRTELLSRTAIDSTSDPVEGAHVGAEASEAMHATDEWEIIFGSESISRRFEDKGLVN